MGSYVPAEGGGAGGRGRGARYPPLSALVVSAIAAFSAVIVLAVVHSVINTVHVDRSIDRIASHR
jgi:protein glucosyltransferase